MSEFPLQLFNVRDHILFKFRISLSLDTPRFSVITVATVDTGDDGKAVFLYRCKGHLEDSDSSSLQRWWCGLSRVGVKASSDA